jgi:hypothetical protein
MRTGGSVPAEAGSLQGGAFMRIPNIRTVAILLGFLVPGVSFFGCAHKVVVEIPPKIDLQAYKTIGIVEFSSSTGGNLGPIATRKFMGFIQDAQPRLRFLELGPEGPLLAALGRSSLDIQAVRAIGESHGVSSVFTGRVEISDVSPVVSIGNDFTSIRASAMVSISLVSKHVDTASGATIWTGSRQGQRKVAGLNSDSKDISFDMDASGEQYSRYVEELAFAITAPFRPRYEKRNAPQ